MRNNILISILIILYTITPGQSGTQNLQVPTIIRPSPTAQNFMRYGEIPVDLSTGVPNIEVPIYTLEARNLKLPISISYHASGIKVHDVATEVGLGWVLNAGGIISRTVFDVKDEQRSGVRTYANADQFLNAVPNIIYNNNSNSMQGVEVLENYLNTKNQNEDLMSDRYFYSLPNGVSGVFRYSYPQDSLIMLPYRSYKIDKTVVTSSLGSIGNNLTEFKIVDDNGITYIYQRFVDSSYYASEWFLKEMTSSDGMDNIKFNYITQEVNNLGTPNSTFLGPKEFSTSNCDPRQSESYPPPEQQGVSQAGNYSRVLTSIESNNTIITFTYSGREDFGHLKKLTEIRIAAKDDPTIIKKRVSFNQSYFTTTSNLFPQLNKRLKLNSITVYGEDSINPQTYSFNYESQELPSYYSQGIDFWGYYNGTNPGTTTHNEFLPPQYQNSSVYANRRADDGSYSKACMIKEITYPSGGKTVFNFERHFSNGLYLYVGANTSGYIGGFRVSKITNYSNNGEIANIKSYEYPFAQFQQMSGEYFNYSQKYADFYVYTPPNQLPNDNNIELNCSVIYNRHITISEPFLSNTIAPGLSVMYGMVKEYEGTPQNHVGTTEYLYSVPNTYSLSGDIWENHSFQNDEGNYEPKLLNKTIKTKNGSKVSEDIFSYSSKYLKEFNTGINIKKNLNILFSNSIFYTMAWYYIQISTGFIPEYIQSIKANNTKAYQKAVVLDYNIKKTYDLTNPIRFVEDSIHYTYNQHNLMLKESSTFNEMGQNIIQKYKYPYDFLPAEPYQSMINKNILTPLLEQITTNNNKQVAKNQVLYKNWGNNIIQPELIKAQTDIVTPLENRIRYLSYDEKGNIGSLKKENGSPITYLWGYNKTLPIAMVENSDFIEQNYIDYQSNYVGSSGFSMLPAQNYILGTFELTEDREVSIKKSYEKPSNYSVVYNVTFTNSTNTTDPGSNFSLTDIVPQGTSISTITAPSRMLKKGNYTIRLNAGYNGYSGNIDHDINFNINYNVPIHKTIPFHTSFEEDTNQVNTVVDAKTGKKSHVGSYTVYLPPSTPGYDKVLVSYWGKPSISSPWQYFESIVDLGGGINHTIGSSMSFIDEVRAYPVGAMMTTFTYDSFNKGQTSKMNPNGQTEYYKYDNFGRLSEIYMIEDNVKKTLKTINHHYKQ